MGKGRNRACAALVAAVLLLAVAAAALEGFLPHTDDGCRTEIHCVACRTGLARTAVQAAVPPVAPVLVALTAPPQDLPRPGSPASVRVLALRGPPTA